MRHRTALVAYEQSDGTYDLHRSERLGRDLSEAWRITELTPYGYSLSTEETPLIEPELIAPGWTFQEIVDDLDYARFGAVIRVADEYEVTPYRALWFGFADLCPQVVACSRIGNGVLVRVDDIHGQSERDVSLCARFDATKRTLARLVDGGQVSPDVARSHLRAHVADLQADREIVRPSGATRSRREQLQHSEPPSMEADVLERWLDPSAAYHGGGGMHIDGRTAGRDGVGDTPGDPE